MKSLIFIALFALAANAFNLTAYSIGEATQLGLTTEQIEAGLPCFTALSEDVAQVVQLIQSGDVIAIATQAGQVFSQIKTDLQSTCMTYFVELGSTVAPYVNASDVESLLKQNFELYYPQIAQQVAYQVNDFITGDDYDAGVHKAIISQILLGMVTPSVPAVPQLNASLYTPFDLESFSTEYYQALISGLGSNELVNGTAINSCLGQVENIVFAVEDLAANYSTYTLVDKVQSVSNFFEVVSQSVEGCEYGVELYSSVFAPILSSFFENPVNFLIQATNNTFINLPSIIQSAQQEEVYILQGQYELAGEAKAQSILHVYGSILNN